MKASSFVLLSGLACFLALGVAGWRASTPHRSATLPPPGIAAWNSAIATITPRIDPGSVPDPATAPPLAVTRFFSRLTAAQRAALVRLAPETVGNLDGVPITLRYSAIEALLPTRSMRLALVAAGGAGSQRTSVREARPGRTLAYDPRGDGRVVQVLGDLVHARHIAVLVPGSSWRLDNSLRWPPGHRVTPLENAAALVTALGPDAAVVMWLGYDAPERVDLAAVGSARAVTGAIALRRFLEGLPSGAHVTLLCHSYGTVVCGRTVAAGTRVGDLVAIGSPGLDVNRASQLPAATGVWAARTSDDPIQITPPVRVLGLGHGTSPVDPAFGARVFRTGTARGHDSYFATGTESLANIVRIVLGHPGQVTLR